MQQPIIEIKNANIYQGDSLVLKEVNLTIREGEFVYLVGRTGTGKSSLLKTLYGDLLLTEGEAVVAEYQLKNMHWKQVPYLRRKLGVVFQDFRLLTDRNVANNLRFVLKATGWTDKKLIDDKVTQVLEQVGLQHKANKMPYEMSGGEQQRVDIARALLNSPKLILADEPTGNLDPVTTDEIMNLLLSIAKESNAAIVMATHDYAVVKKYPARLIKTEGGRVVDNATIDNL
ncbi:ATP-binding cassette domain-containing protein [Niabella yanshanensis]|uniref:ATP-binding cassette domain-containing protein n=1 Tax=Niabella yanshanensis TaxID=577386 RepID=A0ABZ0W8V3_9BACT|nr:ATP-binding cassette domain-containing protein [Niabella yanshanensis]WQD39109.1 ATP-binding cassette domain-containing protein [Niabella yanshanensis]